MRNPILKDFWWKLASLIAASVIWWWVDSSLSDGDEPSISKPRETPILRDFPNMPITVMTAADDTRGFQVDPSVVNVKIYASKEVSSEITAEDIDVFLDLTDIEEAEELSQKIKVIRPPGVFEITVTPPTVRVSRAKVVQETSTLQPPAEVVPDADEAELPAPGILSDP